MRKTYPRRTALALAGGGWLASMLRLRSAPAVQTRFEPERLGIALLGLGNYATQWLAPAIAQSRYARVAGIVTGSLEKVPAWQRRYRIPDAAVYDYENFESIAGNPDIDIVYVVTPTGLHADWTVRALEAGKHVICEKPMAATPADCTRMIEAARRAGRMLQIGYRLYWEPHHVRLMTAMRDGAWGRWNELETAFAYRMTDFDEPSNRWRIGKELGIAGALYDIGVYAVQGAFYAAQTPPVRVRARAATDRADVFTEVPEHWEWELEYADGRRSTHWASYGKSGNLLKLQTESGRCEIEPAYGYSGQAGKTPTGPMRYVEVFQQKRQIDGQMLALHQRAANVVPGEMGRRDIRLIQAVREAASTGQPVDLAGLYD